MKLHVRNTNITHRLGLYNPLKIVLKVKFDIVCILEYHL